MRTTPGGAIADLFRGQRGTDIVERIALGAVLLPGFADSEGAALYGVVEEIAARAPFRGMTTPGGHSMSVTTASCGKAGWVSDKTGYRYDRVDPGTGKPWPAMPALFLDLACRAAAQAGFANFVPDACLINRYVAGAKMSLHQDRNERDFSQPIVSVSLGLPAVFLFGGLRRTERPRRLHLQHGDVVVWGGPARMTFHGVEPLHEGTHPLTGRCRINLTFRKAL
ncbi:MAG: DNA oxidative demethylase AlkB [Burkholderiales bacterium]